MHCSISIHYEVLRQSLDKRKRFPEILFVFTAFLNGFGGLCNRTDKVLPVIKEHPDATESCDSILFRLSPKFTVAKNVGDASCIRDA